MPELPLFAIVGTQVAGDAGMKLVGCVLVGCVAALGGGSVNAVLYGAASPMLGRQKVSDGLPTQAI